jgi:SAM-dependent methyltransferase
VQAKQPEWAWQWEEFTDDNLWLFTEWIAPNTLEDFRDKDVLDCGCGGGQHLSFIAPYCRSAVGVDLNTSEIAKRNLYQSSHIKLQEADIATMDLQKQFDIVYSIGVLHHTDDPDRSFKNIARHCKPGGRLIVWVYSKEGNLLNRVVLEGVKRFCLQHLPRNVLLFFAHIMTLTLYLPIYTLYLFTPRSLGEVGLPYYQYFQNWRKLSYRRNLLNVFDKLNAPQTHFITREQIERWFNSQDFDNVHISLYKGVSYRGSGTKL